MEIEDVDLDVTAAESGRVLLGVRYQLVVEPWEAGRWVQETVTVRLTGSKPRDLVRFENSPWALPTPEDDAPERVARSTPVQDVQVSDGASFEATVAIEAKEFAQPEPVTVTAGGPS